jgi:hypothetical protein
VDLIASVHAAMMTVTLTTGFCLECWKQAVDVMLEKIPDVQRSNKLRIIQFLEADLNQVLCIAFARNISRLAKEYSGIISEHQYGRANKTCITPVLNKLLNVQLLIQKRTEGIVFDNDAKGCYDRIIIGIALACLKRIGYSQKSVRILGLLWSQLEHHVCTGYGVSDAAYSSSMDKILYGIGQGSCASPILWALLNQLLLAALGDKFDCIRLVVSDGVQEHIRPGDSFVDDTTCGATNDDPDIESTGVEVHQLTESEEKLATRMQDIVQFFLGILQVTGGDLAPEKCAWYLICHRWKNGKAILLQPHEQHRGISLLSRATDSTSGIKRKAPEAGHKTLGFHMTGDGTSSAHKKVMKKKTLLFGEAIMSSSLWRSESAIAFNSFYLSSLGYGMCATTLSFQECEDIQRPVINAILPKMGINRKAARAVVFGTAQFGGLGLDHLTTLQGHSRLQYILGHLRCGDHTCRLMRMLIEYTQLECGIMENILEQDYDRFSNCIIIIKWITKIWQHLHSCNATVAVQQKWKPRLGRINDTAIMDCLAASNQFSREELQEINRCRIYLRVFFLSDITNIQGTLIDTWEISGKRQTTRTSAWSRPVQQRPTVWKAWKDTIEFIAPERTVTPALGTWIKEHHQTQEWYYDAEDKIMFHHTNGQLEQQQAQHIGRLRFARKAHLATIPREPLTL